MAVGGGPWIQGPLLETFLGKPDPSWVPERWGTQGVCGGETLGLGPCFVHPLYQLGMVSRYLNRGVKAMGLGPNT